MESAPHPQQTLYVDLGTEVEVYDILRRRKKLLNFKIAFFNTGYIRAADIQPLCYFSLCQLLFAVKAIAQLNNFTFPCSKNFGSSWYRRAISCFRE